jgi:uncharacterized BrkB/YihY/UPF0761 family membrane protein
MAENSPDADPPAEPDRTTWRLRLVDNARARADAVQQRLRRYENRPVVGVVLGIWHRDRESQGSLIASAIAFRLFLFFIPFALFLVGLASLVSHFITGNDVTSAGALSGGVATQIRAAFDQPGNTRWIALGLGLWGMITAGRSLSRVLWAASTIAWREPVRRKASLKIVGALAGLISAIGLVTLLESRIRREFGLGAAGFSFLGAFALYLVAWLIVETMLPRATQDPAASLPGAIIVSLTIVGLHAISELYLPDKLSRASQLYGALGTTVVTLGWFFFIGRAISIGMIVDAEIYERFGGISEFFFSLPVIRLVRKSKRIRAFFRLEDQPSS